MFCQTHVKPPPTFAFSPLTGLTRRLTASATHSITPLLSDHTLRGIRGWRERTGKVVSVWELTEGTKQKGDVSSEQVSFKLAKSADWKIMKVRL